MKDLYADVVVIVKTRLRVDMRADVRPDLDGMLKTLQGNEYADITDEEVLEYVAVEEIEWISEEDALPEEESDDEF